MPKKINMMKHRVSPTPPSLWINRSQVRSKPHCAARYSRLLPAARPKASQAALPREGSAVDLGVVSGKKRFLCVPNGKKKQKCNKMRINSINGCVWDCSDSQLWQSHVCNATATQTSLDHLGRLRQSWIPELVRTHHCCRSNLITSSLSLHTATAKGVKPWNSHVLRHGNSTRKPTVVWWIGTPRDMINSQGTIDAHSQICLGVDQDPQGPDLRHGSCEMQGPALHKKNQLEAQTCHWQQNR